ncbi:junctional protein associated with coronary artery disease [Parambassis ranga]|uniref:Junctional protein associated with coronary artery disease n=1 Tax=Parambassis ranga TaxID=210632 RepID=A0A6P7K1T1_9TELE|nr:junctional protein associated with coronary artery disease-like [Parambassis ranga]
MYSVEDLLISHGYKLPKSGPPSATPYDKRPADCQRELVDNRAGRGTLNGNEADRGASITGIYSSRQALVKGYPAIDNESGIQRRKEVSIGILGDAQPLGDSLATDSGFYDVPSLTYSEPLSHDERDVSYWRRRGQDFSILLDYADGRELRASAGAWRPQALLSAEEYRAERQAQQLWEDISWLRDPDAGPGQLRVTGERKCQSLGTEEWRPAVGLGRQLSDGDGERWAQGHYRLRTPEGFFHPRTKAKSQSLPRVLSPDGTDCRELIPSRPSLPDRQRLNSTLFSGPYSRYIYGGGRDRWGRNVGPSSHVALLPKPRFSRPLKPPSYEIHQQTRGSAEMLAIEQGAKQKDRSIYYQRVGELRHDYFAQHSAISGMEPPGYIPPPSYKRALPPRSLSMNRNEMANLRWRAEALQMPSSDPGRWLTRQTSSSSWLEHYQDRAASYRKQVQSGHEEQPSHGRQIPTEDLRVKQISGGPGGNSLTDLDKIRNINKEVPSAKILGQSTHDSAFPPQQGPALTTETRKTALSDNDSSNRWCNRGIKKSDSVAPEQSRSQFFPSSILGKPPPPPCKPADQGVSETVTEVKKVEQTPEPPEKDKSKNLKKRLSETIFCLVSVPVTPQLTGTIRDQNNNNEKSPDPADSPSDNKTGHLTNQSLQSTSSAEAELQALTGSIASSKTSSRASSKIFKKLPCRPPKINHYKELKLSGSWPANQYRDQETQTSPEAQKPDPENKEAQQDPVPPGTEVAPDGGSVVGTAFSFPIKGVKSLKLSSNSAFSLTSTFSNQLNKSTAQQPAVPLSGNVEETKPAANSGQEAFEQFLLKPASQRTWDAVKELENIKKEVQDQQQQQQRSNDGRTIKLDLPDEPIETPLCDFSPTAQTTTAAEVPWADRQPMQDASTLTSPPDYEDICQALRQSRDSTDVNKASTGHSRPNDGDPLRDLSADSEEECPICKRELENQMRQGPLPPLHEENSSDSSANQNGSPPQHAALESPADDTKREEQNDSSVNQSGSGTSAETMEQHSLTQDSVGEEDKVDSAQAENSRTDNPAESLQANGDTEDISSDSTTSATHLPTDPQDTEEERVNENVTKEVELEEKEEVETGVGISEGQDNTSTDDKQEKDKKPFAVPEHRVGLRTHLGRDHPVLPEFPPDRLPLSVPPNLDRRLSLSLEGERRSRGPSNRMEALQNKLAISPGRVAVEHLARMRDVDVMYRMRRLSIRSTDSGEGEAEAEAEGEGKEEQAEELQPDPQNDNENNQEVTHSQQVSEETVLQTKEEESSLSGGVSAQRRRKRNPRDPSRGGDSVERTASIISI